jgi:hypothetical protein
VYWEWRYSSTHSLTSALDGGEWSASRPGCSTPRERASGTHCIGDWVGLKAVLDAVVKRKIHSPRRELNPRTPIVQPVAQRYTDWAITALIRFEWLRYIRTNLRIFGNLGSCSSWTLPECNNNDKKKKKKKKEGRKEGRKEEHEGETLHTYSAHKKHGLFQGVGYCPLPVDWRLHSVVFINR